MGKRVIFLGPPGSGKGTQAQRLAQETGIPHISTGEILREAKEKCSPLGEKAREYMDKGELVPDELLLGLIRDRLKEPDTSQGWILDGFPRNVEQAMFLDRLLAELQQQAETINLEVSDQVIIQRLSLRGREDDHEETVRYRLEVYREHTAPTIEYYRSRGLHCVDADRSPDEVTASLKAILNGEHQNS